MHVSALAEALEDSRRPNGVVSLDHLVNRLSRAGLEELSRAACTLAHRSPLVQSEAAEPPERPWV